MSIPAAWFQELAALCIKRSEEEKRLVTVPDIIRIAIIKQYFLAKNEMMPKFKSLKPVGVVNLPDLETLLVEHCEQKIRCRRQTKVKPY